MTTTIQKITVPYLGPPTVASLPEFAVCLGAMETSNVAVGGAMSCSLLFEVDSAEPLVARTFVTRAVGDVIDPVANFFCGLWYQRTGSGVVTPHAIYEVV